MVKATPTQRFDGRYHQEPPVKPRRREQARVFRRHLDGYQEKMFTLTFQSLMHAFASSCFRQATSSCVSVVAGPLSKRVRNRLQASHFCLAAARSQVTSEDALRLQKNDLTDDFFDFSDLLADEAEVCQKYHPLRAHRSSPKSNRAKGTEDENKTRLSSSPYPV